MNKSLNILLIFVVFSTIFIISSCTSKDKQEIEDRNAYLLKNYPDAIPTESGLYYIETEAGTGKHAEVIRTVKVHYEGKFLDGKVFDSSYDRNEPIEFTLGVGQVIKGWDEGISYMSEGGKAVLIIPSNLAYGTQDRGTIPGYSTLVFTVELIEVK